MDLDSINRPLGPHLKDQQVDNVARALLSLTRHVCVLTDRIAVLEAVLQDNGIDAPERVDTHQPDEALKEKISTLTNQIISDIVSDLKGG